MNNVFLKLFVDALERYQKLSDAEFGRLIRAALIYKRSGEEIELSGRESLMWDGIKIDLNLVPRKSTKGNKHWNWKGGLTPKNQRDRNSREAHEWRTLVFRRDDYTCQKCHVRGRKINAHHIIPWAKNESLRYELSNGITLCEKCHKEIHKRK